ncbi:MAG: condensation domain-containing protein, partial [Planctomycetota bacterium]|nr:condensation domain-containing protein [Planctomycetota bacterium]
MSDLPARIDSLSPAKRELLARRLRRTLEESGEAIGRRERASPVPVSPGQERLFFLHQLDAQSVAYNLSQAYRLSGPVDAGVLRESFGALVARHESLRTTFAVVDAQAVQIVHSPGPFELEVLAADSVERAQQLVNEDARRPFDLAAGPLLRARLIRLGERDHVLAVTMHHIISDGWSVAVLWMDLSAFYNALTAGQALPLREMPVQYADFALWQRGRLSGELVERQLAYWREQLRGAPAAVALPFDRQPPAPRASGGGAWGEVWPRSLADAAAAVGRQAHATPFMTHLAAFAVLLARHTGQDEVIVGSPISARSAVETEPLIGFFVNTLPLRIDLSGRPDFPELLARVRATMLAAHENQDVPFDVLVADLKGDRAQGRTPLVQVMFGFQEARRTYLALANVSVAAFPADTGAAKAELTVELLQRPQGVDVRFEYDCGLFDPPTIERMGGHYRRLLEEIVADPRRPVAELPMLSQAEGRQLVTEWNDTAREYLRAGSVNALVEAWAARTPDALAALAGGASLTYRQLNARANRLARGLVARGLRPEECVGVCLERSLDTVVAML